MKVLLIGYGSIGKRHEEVLKNLSHVDTIEIVTKQTLENKKYISSLKKIKDLNIYDYFVIASETSKHYEQLKYICSKVNHKKILVEKPMFDKKYESFTCKNDVFTAYNLRFHPLLQKLKNILIKEKVYYVNVICGQYLPTWRPEQDYRKSYSADLSMGGGVLRDLSHELDYISWLFGDIKDIKYINTKISDLEINSDDIFTGVGLTENSTIFNISMDYISKIPMRKMLIHAQDTTIEADIITNTIKIKHAERNEEKIILDSIDRNYTYTKMHQAVIFEDLSTVCHFHEGMKVVDLIDQVFIEEL